MKARYYPCTTPALISHGAGVTQCRDVADSVDSQRTGLLPLVCSLFEEGYCVVASSGHGVVAAVAVVTRLWQGLWQHSGPQQQPPQHRVNFLVLGPATPARHCTVLYRCRVRARTEGNWDLLRWYQNRAAAVSPTPGHSTPGSYTFNNNYE